MVIYVIVQDNNGNLYLTKGGTYSYYEFTVPKNDIMNDEEWRILLKTSPPNMPNWIENIATILMSPNTLILFVNSGTKDKRCNRI